MNLPRGGCETIFAEGKKGNTIHSFACDVDSDYESDVQHLIDRLQRESAKVIHSILNKCDLIYVCNMCRELFCTLEHFIAHDGCDERSQFKSVSPVKIQSRIQKLSNNNEELRSNNSGKKEPNVSQVQQARKNLSINNGAKNSNGARKRTNSNNASPQVARRIKSKPKATKYVLPAAGSLTGKKIKIKLKPVVKTANSNGKLKSMKSPRNAKNSNNNNNNKVKVKKVGGGSVSGNKVVLRDEAFELVNLKENTCVKCNMSFCNKFSLLRHVAIHHLGYVRYKCRYCKFKSNLSTVLHNHLIKNHIKKEATKLELDKFVVHNTFHLNE